MTNKKEIMKMAHKLAKTFTGDYQARLALALKLVWAKIKRIGRTLEDTHNKIEVFYGEYKNKYSNLLKGEYNAETKKIEVYFLKDEFITEAAMRLQDKLESINVSDATNAEKMKNGNDFLNYLVRDYNTTKKTIVSRLAEIRASRA